MTLFEEIKAAGIPFSNHESDLYFPRTKESVEILARHPLQHKNSESFINQAPPNVGEHWIDVPFGYDPWWQARGMRLPTNVEYTICKHCDHFVEPNSGENVAKYIHLDDGEQEYDHDAEPGEKHTDAEWHLYRIELFKMYPDKKIGPNSQYHSRRGKTD